MKFENLVPRLKLHLEQHYNDLMKWRDGQLPSKKPRRQTAENWGKKSYTIFLQKWKIEKEPEKTPKMMRKDRLRKFLKSLNDANKGKE